MENGLEKRSDADDRLKVRIDGQVYNLLTPEPTGRDLLAKAGRDPVDFFLVLSIEEKPDQVLELDEPFDLRSPGIEVLTVVSRERRFPIQVDEQNLTVKGPFINGAKLLELVGKTPEKHFVTQVLVGVDDIVIGPEDRVDLTVPGREHFTIVAKPRENDHELTVEVFSPRFPDKPKSFTWAKTMKVSDAAREAATAFGYVGGSPGLQTIVPPPGAGRVLDNNRQLSAENLKDGDQLEIVDTGGGV